MKDLFYHPDALADLQSLGRIHPIGRDRIEAFVEMLAENPGEIDNLLDHGYGKNGSAPYDVCRWQEHWRDGKDLWRLSLETLKEIGLRLRIIYAYFPQSGDFFILAIAPREFDYEAEHEITKRILSSYDEIRNDHG